MEDAPYRDPDLAVADRVADLLGRMTLDEKLEQMQTAWRGRLAPDGGIESFHPGPSERLGIPVLMPGECLHGVMIWAGDRRTPTVYPQAIALGSTWDPDLVERVASAIAREARSMGLHHCMSPVFDVARDARFGRTEECYGEDPLLVTRLGVAFVHGLQGRGGARFDRDHVVATAKHFAGYHEGQRGINGAACEVSERTFREVHLPPFEAAVRAGVGAVMPAHSDINGIPCHADRSLLTGLLRDAWGFDGLVITDNRDIARLHSMHHVAGGPIDAAVLGLQAGCDQEISMQVDDLHCYGEPLREAVERGLVEMGLVDRATGRVLALKFQLGLFDHPEPPQPLTADEREADRLLALEAARKAIVLLQNTGALLPLDAATLQRVAVIGPNADDFALGSYVGWNTIEAVTVLDGLRSAWGDGVEIAHARGCDVFQLGRDGFDEAVAAAAGADVAVVVLGDSTRTCGEGFDRDDLVLPGEQQALLEAVEATGTPVVLVLLNGRPADLRWAVDHVEAIVEGWYLGIEGGTAVADVLRGAVNPGGKLTVTVPRSVGQCPMSYRRRASFTGSGGGRYIDDDGSPLFPFGHGLSYTTFSYSPVTIEPAVIAPDARAVVSVDVTNSGDRAGDEIVQLYVRDDVASVTRPLLELKAFERLTFGPGETRRVAFEIGADELSLLDRDFRRVVEPGTFTVFVGTSSADLQEATLEVVAAS